MLSAIIHDINRDKKSSENKEGRHISIFHRVTAIAVLAYAIILGLESFKNYETNRVVFFSSKDFFKTDFLKCCFGFFYKSTNF